MTLQNVEIICPWCQQLETFKLSDFHGMYAKVEICRSMCGEDITADRLSAKYLSRDIQNFMDSKIWYIPSDNLTFRAGKGVPSRQFSKAFEIILPNDDISQFGRHEKPSWRTYTRLEQLNGSKKGRKTTKDILFRLRATYMGIVWQDLSIDLVAACLRQHVYTSRVMNECQGIDTPMYLSDAVARYHKFMFLMKALDSKRTLIVPTLDIDLCWHTHQLFPRLYREWCIEHLGRTVNHDDTIEKAVATRGLRATSLAWLDFYCEPYTGNNLRKAYFSPARKCAGILFPPYGLFMLYLGRKLDRARICMDSRLHCSNI